MTEISEEVLTALLPILIADDADSLSTFLTGHGARWDVPLVDKRGRSLLFLASREGGPGCVDLLLRLGSSPNERMEASPATLRRTPLNAALSGGKFDVADVLLRAGANPRITDHYGDTPILVAIGTATPKGAGEITAEVRARAEMIGRLAQGGCPVNQANFQGSTPLAMAVARGVPLRLVRALLHAGADPDQIDPDGNRPVHLRLEGNDVLLMRMLSAGGADISAPNRRGQTPLHLAADFLMLEALIRLGANMTAVDHEGRTAFHHRVAERTVDTFEEPSLRFLLGEGADPRQPDYAGETAYECLSKFRIGDDGTAKSIQTYIAAIEARNALKGAIRQSNARRPT